MRDTVYALSSGALPAGIAVVRVSGPGAAAVTEALCGALPAPRTATLSAFSHSGDVLDRGLVLWFPAPASFTGEDVVEFQVHGGRSVVRALLQAVGTFDHVRPALAGEFSRRAFDNGRLDLTEVEGLADLIAAETEVQRRQALLQTGGQFRRSCERWRDRLISARAHVEAELDFADEDDVVAIDDRATSLIAAVQLELDEVLRAQSGERVRDGFRVALMGLPNSGKSTLLNVLAQRDVAIVTDEAGTTRDVLEVHLDVAGYPVILFDTAGQRTSTSGAEREGVRRAQEAGRQADLVLWLAEPGHSFDEAYGEFNPRTIRVRSKADLGGQVEGDVSISAKTGAGLDRLIQLLTDKAEIAVGRGDGVITRARHRHWLGEASRCLGEAERADLCEAKASLLREASDAIGRITGRVDVEDVLDKLFGEFCIGK